MKKLLSAITIILLSSNTYAQLSPVQLEKFKMAVKQACIKRGNQYQAEEVVKRCSCLDEVLRNNLTEKEFQNFAKLTLGGRHPFKIPYIKKLIPKVKMCSNV